MIHIAIVCGERDLLELRFGSIRSRDLLDLTCLSASQQGQCDELILLAARRDGVERLTLSTLLSRQAIGAAPQAPAFVLPPSLPVQKGGGL